MHDLLSQLKGARLSAFIALALNETELCLGLGKPLSIHAIAAQAHLSPRHVLRAMQDLVAQDLATAVSERGSCREKLYRVSEYARTGRAIAAVAASPRKAKAGRDTHTRVAGTARARVPAARKRSNADCDTPTHVSESTTANARVSSTKSKIDHDTLSGSMTPRVPSAHCRSNASPDTSTHVSDSTRMNSRNSSTKSKIDYANLSGSTTPRVPSAHRRSNADPGNGSGSATADSRVSSTKSPIAPDAPSREPRSPRAHTRTRVRARARVVVVNNINSSSLVKHEFKQQQQQHFEASRAIFAAAHVTGHPLTQLARTVDADLARAWTERLEDAPKSFTDPVGYLVKHLLRDPGEAPPEAWAKKKAKGLFDAEFAKYVHGRPEHTQYCREHPEEVDCQCGVL